MALSALLSLLKHLNSALRPAAKEAATRDHPKLLPEDSPPNNSPPLHNSPWQTQSQETKAPFIADIKGGGQESQRFSRQKGISTCNDRGRKLC